MKRDTSSALALLEELSSPADLERLGAAMLLLGGQLLRQAGAAKAAAGDDTAIDLVAEGLRRGLFPSRAIGFAHARAGRLHGAVRVGRKWCGPAAALDRFVVEHGARPAPGPTSTPAGDDLLEVTRAAARRGRLRIVGGTR